MKIHLIVINITLLLAACTPAIPSISTPTQESSSHPTPTIQGENPTMAPIPSTPSASSLQSLIEKAKGNLAQRLSISSSQIDLVEARDVVWPDSSLGCPQKGMVYADVLTPGYLIILSTNNMEYEYHTSERTEVIYCQNPTPPVENLPDNT